MPTTPRADLLDDHRGLRRGNRATGRSRHRRIVSQLPARHDKVRSPWRPEAAWLGRFGLLQTRIGRGTHACIDSRVSPASPSGKPMRCGGVVMLIDSIPPLAHESPHLGRERRHVCSEEHAEHADHRVERAARQTGRSCVREAKLEVDEAVALGPGSAQGPAAAPPRRRPGRCPRGPTARAAGIADAPAPQHRSRTALPGASAGRDTVAAPNLSQKPSAAREK